MLLFNSCSNDLNNNQNLTKNLNFTNKDLNRLYYGNKYYKINGVFDKSTTTTLKKPNAVLLLESKNFFIDNYLKISLIDKKVKFYLHDLIEFSSIPILINFNNYIKNKFYYLPTFSMDNLELLKNRSSKVYTLDSDNLLTPFYIDELNYRDNNISLKEIIVYDNTLENISNLIDIGLYPVSYESFKFIHNPLSNLYSIYPDLRYFSTKKNNIFDLILSNIKTYSKSDISNYTDYVISRDTTIYKDLHIRGMNFIIKEGVSLNLSNDASIFIDNSRVYFEGETNNQIEIIGFDDNSIKFSNCDEININNVNFKNLSNLNRDSLTLTASITVYNSDIKIKNSNFENNLKGDDFINFYNSNFDVQSSNFHNIVADAIDSDFSNGVIENSSFVNIGNDAVDFSGSNSSINKNLFINVGDKSVSAGENSNVTITSSTFENSELGIVVKDGSDLKSENNKFINNSIDYCAFIKKTFYKQPILRIEDYENEKYLFQNNVTIYSNGTEFKRVEDVESLLYGNIYGRSSN